MQTSKISSLNCPVDFIPVNENKVRVTAFFVLSIAITFIFTQHPVFPALLAFDFFLRAFKFGKFSPLAFLSEKTVTLLKFPYKATDQAPKRFAAKIGFLFTLSILIFYFANINTLIISLILIIFAALESFVGFCAGCYVYTFLKPFLFKTKKVQA